LIILYFAEIGKPRNLGKLVFKLYFLVVSNIKWRCWFMALAPEEEQKIFCNFKQIRSWVMSEVWRKAEILQREGVPLSHELFSTLIRDTWRQAKEKSEKICPIVSIEKVKEILKKYEAKPLEVHEVKAEAGEVHGEEGGTSGKTSAE
jgi:hypothetical protein